MESNILLDLKNVNKVFGNNHVLKNINLKIERGSSLPSLVRVVVGRRLYYVPSRVSIPSMMVRCGLTGIWLMNYLHIKGALQWCSRNMPCSRI